MRAIPETGDARKANDVKAKDLSAGAEGRQREQGIGRTRGRRRRRRTGRRRVS